MILDQYGQPVPSRNAFVTPRWLLKEARDRIKRDLEHQLEIARLFKILELRESLRT